MKAIGYVRVSTTDQANGLSLESQQRAISEEVARRGWELAGIEKDAASGKNARRPGLQSALRDLKLLGEHGALVVYRLDRLARSLGDFCGMLQRADKEHWALVCMNPNVDLTDPYGRCMAQVAGAFAELEHVLISQRQKESVAARKAAGTYKGPQSRTSPETEERIIALFDSGMGARQVAQQLGLEGYEPPLGGEVWHPRSVARIAQRVREGR